MFVRLEFFILKYASSRPKSWALIVVSFGLVLSLFSKFPAYTDAHAKYPGSFAAFPATPYGQAIQWWLEHPLRPVPVAAFFPVETREVPGVAGMMSHCEKLTFRIFLPLLNQVVGGKIWTLVGANYLATLSSFFFIYQLCRRVTGDVLLATFSTLGVRGLLGRVMGIQRFDLR